MRLAVGLVVTSVLAVIAGSVVFSGTPKELEVSEGKIRLMLTTTLAKDIVRFKQERRFSKEDGKFVDEIWASFSHDPPLKTDRELQLDLRLNKGPSGIGGLDAKKQLKKKVEEYLVRVKIDLPPLSAHLELTFDLERCVALKNIFIVNNVTSEALDELTRRVVHKIRMTKES